MESLTDVLKAMGKATARELAARMKIENIEALNMLRDQEETGKVQLLNGYWQVVENQTSPAKVKPARPARKSAVKRAPAKPETSSPEAAPSAPEPAKIPAPIVTAKSVIDIPKFTERRADDLVIPAPKFLAQEIRRTKTKLARLEKVRALAAEMRKHKKLFSEISGIEKQ